MTVGVERGWQGGPVHGLSVAVDLSDSALSYGFARLKEEGATAKYLYVSPLTVETAKRILYAFSVARGYKACPVSLCSDSTLEGRAGFGWLLSDERRPNTSMVDWEYVFPQHVKVVDGYVTEDKDEDVNAE
jgi:hypothetical protein